MGKARQILTRQKAVQNIRKVTRTMELIATSRFKKSMDQATNLRVYTDALTTIVHKLVHSAGAMIDQPLLQAGAGVGRDALMVVASNRGMCGGYNLRVLRLAKRQYDELIDQGRQVEVYAVGKKAVRFLNFHGIETCWQRPQFEGGLPLKEVALITEELKDRFLTGKLDTVLVAHTRYVSASVQQPTLLTLLPLGEPQPAATAKQQPIGRQTGAKDYDLLPDPETILSKLLARTLHIRLYQAMLDSIVSEHMARMAAMHLATDNAEEMIRQLTMQAHRARQASITTELAEILGGAEATA
ncbi:MAG: ATP synthase F1 subunit gamma [Planctomycetes bacterium]|nr:ATP synthase F1 subunit gamma [Planctomycetota bacterium]